MRIDQSATHHMQTHLSQHYSLGISTPAAHITRTYTQTSLHDRCMAVQSPGHIAPQCHNAFTTVLTATPQPSASQEPTVGHSTTPVPPPGTKWTILALRRTLLHNRHTSTSFLIHTHPYELLIIHCSHGDTRSQPILQALLSI